MKKFIYIVLFLVTLFLSGCNNFLSRDEITFEIQDNIEIAVSQYDDFDWSKVIKIRYQGKILSLDDAEIKRISGDIKPGQLCKYSISYKINTKTFSDSFYVKIVGDEFIIKEVLTLKNNTKVIVKGTVSLVNETGFILTDDTASIFVTSSTDIPSKGNTVQIDGIYSFDDGHKITADKIKVTTEQAITSVPINLSNSEFLSFANSYTNNSIVKYVTVNALVKIKDNNVLLQIDNKHIELDSHALDEITSLLTHENKIVSISGWIYKISTSTSNLVMMVDKVNFSYDSSTIIGNQPVIEIESSYYFYTDINNVLKLTSYFKATDKEDGQITITSDMISGTVKQGQNIISATVTDSDSNVNIASIVIEVGNYNTTETNENVSVIDEYSTPSLGDVNVLVIPISFPGYPATNEMLDVIEKGFFGSEKDTGWESVRSYYLKSSYGNLRINGDVTDWYTPKKSQSYYANYMDDDNYGYGSTILLEEALKAYKYDYDYSNYDSNNDGYIDAVYLVYNVSVGGNGSSSQEEFYWAFTYWDSNVDSRTYSDVKGYAHVFLGYDFFNDELMFSNKEININCETAIHETAHLFNLEDYYDYDEYDLYRNDGGYCGIDMMEYNVGDHCPYSKLLLGWINPVVIRKSGIYELPSFTNSGVTFLIDANGKFSSIFDEYYLIDYYTLDGLNELELKSYFNTPQNYAGVRISHINASLTYEDRYFPIFTYNNSDTKYKQIRMLEADYNGKFDMDKTNDGATLDDFFKVGQTFGTDYYSTYKSYSGNPLPFTMTVLSLNDEFVTVKITFK